MDDVKTRIEGRAGIVTLARPQALNALSHTDEPCHRGSSRRLV